FRFGAVQRDALATSPGLVCSCDFLDAAALCVLEAAAQMECGRVEAHQLLVGCATEGAEDLEVVDRLEQVRLAGTVLTDDRGAGSRELQLELSKVAVVAQPELATYRGCCSHA